MKHVHDCTGPTQTCPCGYKFTVPPILVSIEVIERGTTLVDEHFNCDDEETAIAALERAMQLLMRRRYPLGVAG